MWLLGLVGATCLAGAARAGAAPFVYVADGGGSVVSQYDAAAGSLTPLAPAFVAAGQSPAGVAVSPDGRSLYAANRNPPSAPGARALPGTVSQYSVGASGGLSPKTPAFVAAGVGPAGVAVSPDGRSVYVANFFDDTVSQYTVGAGGGLSPKTPASVAAGVGPAGVAVSPDGRSVYVTNAPTLVSGTISQYDVGAGGALSAKSPATVPAGRAPSGIAVSPSGTSVYVADALDNDVRQYDVGAGGALMAKTPAAVAAGSGPGGVAVSPDGRSLYVANAAGSVSQYDVGAGGALTANAPATVTAGSGAIGIAVTPEGGSVYVTDNGDDTVSQYGVLVGGSLIPRTPATVHAGAGPTGIAIAQPSAFLRCATCPVLGIPSIRQVNATAATITFRLAATTNVGILVERIVGRRLVRVGAVPLGRRRMGRARIRWNLRVNGHRLAKGRYLITLRALGNHGHVIARARAVTITIR
jgi:DNA-binding beta-propeller fold protein YncE